MTHRLLSILGLIVLSCFTMTATAADDTRDVGPITYLPALAGDYFPIESTAVGRKYHIFVRFPEGYSQSTEAKYPVVYLLDGDSLFPLLAPTHLFLTYDEKLPEAILVGISYGGFDSINKRHVDFSAPATDATSEQGGAPKFLSFLKSELIPAVENRYRTDPKRRVLLGQSRGGYFVLWSALEDPDLFWGRIASNPSFGPGRDRFFASARWGSTSGMRIAVASGSRDTAQRQSNAQEWIDHWSQQTSKAPWEVRLFPIENGTHAATIGETYRQTMLWLFQREIQDSKSKQ